MPDKRFRLTRRSIRKALDTLAEDHAPIAAAVASVGYPDERRRPAGFEALARIIVGQQVSTKAASAIFSRFETALGGDLSAEAVLSTPEPELRAAGLSGQKVGYMRALAEAIRSGALPVNELRSLSDAEVVAAMTAVKGFGVWSAHMFLMFSLGRPDIWPSGDLAVREGFARMLSLEPRQTPKRVEVLAAPYAPYRSSVALLCWKYYSEAPL